MNDWVVDNHQLVRASVGRGDMVDPWVALFGFGWTVDMVYGGTEGSIQVQVGTQVDSSYSEAIYLQYDINGQTGLLKIACCVKINAPPLHLSRDMGTASYDVQFETFKSPEYEDVVITGRNSKPYLGVALAR